MAVRIVIPFPQNFERDCYAACPSIDLTLRSNGEEQVQVMDAQGNFYSAGLGDGPTVVPTHANGSAGSSFPAAKYWTYRYVWVAKVLFPKVENAVTGGGSSAPRTNPSPGSTTATGTGNKQTVTVGTSTDPKFSHIWIYRTPFVDTAVEALVDSDAGLAFWIGEVANNISVSTVTFTDDGSYVAATEQIENDNFVAPQFSLCVFAEPYFYGIGNRNFSGNVTIDTAGIITLTPERTPAEQWFNGRDRQTVRFSGINVGGYDGLGSFYFKQLTGTTAQLYMDIALTDPTDAGYIGTTRATISGNSHTLYRSKARNPLSWGVTDVIDDVLVPHLYFFSVGSGSATAIGVLPNYSLLKIDLESPNSCITLNLRNAGTASFEPSLRIVSTSYSAGSQASQFLATVAKGNTALWAYDPKSFAIVQCDGSDQMPISTNVFESLRSSSQDEEHHKYIHANYHPRLELNLLFLNDSRADDTQITHALYFHASTLQWGVLDGFNITASGQIRNPATNETLLFVGTYEGLLGEYGAPDQYTNWEEEALVDKITPATSIGDNILTLTSLTVPLDSTAIGSWITAIYKSESGIVTKRFARIDALVPVVVPGTQAAISITFQSPASYSGATQWFRFCGKTFWADGFSHAAPGINPGSEYAVDCSTAGSASDIANAFSAVVVANGFGGGVVGSTMSVQFGTVGLQPPATQNAAAFTFTFEDDGTNATFPNLAFSSTLILNDNFATVANFPVWEDNTTAYFGLIELQVGRFFNAKIPSATKKLEEIWSTWIRGSESTLAPSLQLGSSYIFYGPEIVMELAENTAPQDSTPVTYKKLNDLPISYSRILGLRMLDRNPSSIQLMNYELHLAPDASPN